MQAGRQRQRRLKKVSLRQRIKKQRRRFETDLRVRGRAGQPTPPLDERLLAALAAGLPDCAGVAIGFDRVVMVAAGCDTIDDVISFGGERA